MVQKANAPGPGRPRRALTSPTYVEVKMAEISLCSIPDCDKNSEKRGWCGMHYRRWQRHGDPVAGKPPRVSPGSKLQWLIDNTAYQGDDCLQWPFAYEPNGYGGIVYEGKHTSASRVICIFAKGPPPSDDHEAAHSCGKGGDGCLNPNHLEWSLPVKNQGDRVAHGTHNRGARAPAAKLTEDDVRLIRSLEGQETSVATASRFGVSKVAVRKIQKRENWGWLE